jgi:hypothetical protein
VLVGSSGRVDGPPLDPRSTSPTGTRALVLLLESLGAEVELAATVPERSDAVVLVLRDTFDTAQRDDLLRTVRRGGRVIVADPGSPLGARPAGVFSMFGPIEDEQLERGECDIAALQQVGAIDISFAPLLQRPFRGQSCFGDGEQAFVVTEQVGDGAIVTLGGAGVLTNGELGNADNAALAAALLAPQRGTRVLIAQPVLAAEGDTSFVDLAREQLGPGLPFALAQLVLAMVLYAAYRARRLGRPVPEPQPVQIAGSELVLAVGRLLQRGHSVDAAAAALRAQVRTELCAARGLPAATDARVLAASIAPLAGRDRDDVYRALADAPVASDVELLELVEGLDEIRQEVFDRGSAHATNR